MSLKNNLPLITISFIIVIAILVSGVAYYNTRPSSNNQKPSAVQTPIAKPNAQPNLVGTKFSDSRFYKNAYLISLDNLSGDAQAALSGFAYSKNVLSDGSLNITLLAISKEYQNQNYIVKSGQQLYFIENSMGDDSPPNGEYNLMDDHAVLVDQNGYIVAFS